MKAVTSFLKGMILASGLAFAGAANAQEISASTAPGADASEVMSAEDMDALSGGTGIPGVITITTATLTATNSGNSVVGDTVSSGNANIGANAFSGYAGIGNFVINTGHNNNLQSTVNVSVVLPPMETTP